MSGSLCAGSAPEALGKAGGEASGPWIGPCVCAEAPRPLCSVCGEGVCVVFQVLGCGNTGRCDRGQSALPATLVCVSLPGLSSSFPALLSFIPSFSGRTAGRRHTGAPPTVPQQRCFLLSFSARGMQLRGDDHAPGYRSMFKALFKSQDLT